MRDGELLLLCFTPASSLPPPSSTPYALIPPFPQSRDPPLDGNTEISQSTANWLLLAVGATSLNRAMWQRFNNLISSLQTYDALSPDLKVRRQVNRALSQRPAMQPEQWFELYAAHGITSSVAAFAYDYLARYSALEFGRVLPEDRLNEDLCWTQVCWFDWELALCSDFCQQFGSDLDNVTDCFSERLENSTLLTVCDLLLFLNQYGTKPVS